MNPKILIIETNPQIITSLNNLSAILPVACVLAQDYKEALRYAENIGFALILLKMDMPEIDGVNIVTTIKTGTRNADTPILFTSGTDAYNDDTRKESLTV